MNNQDAIARLERIQESVEEIFEESDGEVKKLLGDALDSPNQCAEKLADEE